ncbi:MAG: helix-turn-helix domain-containing protein [Clostridiales bacterium]|nr:helix-turn-helix domain-containing protein [Clostridiales bacterium]
MAINDKQKESAILSLTDALSSPVRLEILRQLYASPLPISQIAKANLLSVSSATFHISVLEKAGIVSVQYTPSKKGKIRICSLILFQALLSVASVSNDTLMSRVRPIDLNLKQNETYTTVKRSCPVGHYVDAVFEGFSGFATTETQYMITDRDFYPPERADAGIIWAAGGRIVYAFSNCFGADCAPVELSFALELCSETLNYQNDWMSDITFSINGVEIVTFTSPGDLGGRRGTLNPSWWSDYASQYGLFTKLSVTPLGVYFNGLRKHDRVKINDLNLTDCNKITLKIENKPDAVHIGGFNIFGKGFGDFPQDIEMSATYKETKKA